MEFGVTFPQTDIEPAPTQIRHFGESIESIGYDHLLAYDHVLGVKPPHPEWEGSYDYRDQFLEPLVLFSHLAAVTVDIDFITGVLVLPQRETALVAKQAAMVSLLSDDRFVLGAGVGWNDREYRNLGADFETRGARIEEQIEVLRSLWDAELVDYDGDWHDIDDAGINPRPPGASIPIWLGGGAVIVLRRIARDADGWIAPTSPIPQFEKRVETLRGYLDELDRDPDAFPIHVRIKLGDTDDWIDHLEAFEELGVSHVGVGTMNMGHTTADGHLAVLTEAMNELHSRGFA